MIYWFIMFLTYSASWSCKTAPEERVSVESRSEAKDFGEIYIESVDRQGTAITQGVFSQSVVRAYTKHLDNGKRLTESTEGVALVRELQPYSLRFPGGSFSRKFRPFEKRFANMLDEHVKLSRMSGVNKTMLVVDMYNGSLEEAFHMMDVLQKNNIEVVAVELGNEYHLNKYRDKIPAVEDFIALIQQWSTAFRTRYPGIPLGIPVASARHVFDAEQMSGRRVAFYENWNGSLAEAFSRRDIEIDAVIPHFYKQTYMVYDKPTKEERFEGVMNELRIDSYDFLNKAVIDYYTGLFGEEVALWVTEWGLKEKQVYGNTVAEGLHVTAFLLDLMKGNHLNDNRLEYACYQKLVSKPSLGLITPVGKFPSVQGESEYKRETAWYAFDFFNAFREGGRIVNSKIKGCDQKDLRMEIFVRGEDAFIVFANRSPQAYRMNYSGEGHYLFGKHPWSSNGMTAWNRDGDEFDPVYLEEGVKTNVIKPFAYGYIKVKVADLPQ